MKRQAWRKVMTFSANRPSDASLLWSDSHATVAFYDHRLRRVDLESKKSLDCRSGSSSSAIFLSLPLRDSQAELESPKIETRQLPACLPFDEISYEIMDTFSSVLRRCVRLDSSSNRRRTPIGTFLWTNKGSGYHRSVTWSASSKGHRRRPTENQWSCKRLHFLSRLPTTRPATLRTAKFELGRWNVWNSSVSLSGFVVVSLRGLNLLCFFSASSPASCMFLISDQRNVFSFALLLSAPAGLSTTTKFLAVSRPLAARTLAFRQPQQQRSIEIVFWLNLNCLRRLIMVS